ncbi:hypothetical protein D0463_18475 [Bacillus sp. V59.32b]|nr:hypothetical protein D0463_18475 [Bacillus sp. V59.32b]
MKLLRTLCRKGIEIIEATACKDHVHKLVSIQIKEDVVAEQLSFVEYNDPFTGEEVKKTKRDKRKSFEVWPEEVLLRANYSIALYGLVSNKGFQSQRKPSLITGWLLFYETIIIVLYVYCCLKMDKLLLF